MAEGEGAGNSDDGIPKGKPTTVSKHAHEKASESKRGGVTGSGSPRPKDPTPERRNDRTENK